MTHTATANGTQVSGPAPPTRPDGTAIGIAYEIVDMLADRPFAGSALCVVLDAEHLSDTEMAAIAREINTSETAFVLPPVDPAATHRVRVFTPFGPTAFGGHSSIGTAATLVRLGRLPAGALVQECEGRLTPLTATADSATITASGPGPTTPLTARESTDLLAGCGLAAHDLLTSAGACGFGPDFHFLPLRPIAVSHAAIDTAHPVWTEYPDAVVFAWDPVTRSAHARTFAPGYRMPEDPACASAALALGAWLVQADWLPSATGSYEYRVHQGGELGRPSTAVCTVTVENGAAMSATVTGAVLPSASGRIARPVS